MGRLPDSTYRLSRLLASRKRWDKLINAIHQARPKIPQSQAYRITQWLTFHAALVEGAPGYTVDVRRLLDTLAGVRRANLTPSRVLTTVPDPRRVTQALAEAKVRHAWGFATAANLHAFFEPLERLQLYVEAWDASGLDRPRLEALLPRGAAPIEVYDDKVQELHLTEIARLPATELFETAIDVRAHPRAGAYADLLQRAIEEAAR